MKEKLQKKLNHHGYNVSKETDLLEMAELIWFHYELMIMLKKAHITIPGKTNSLDIDDKKI